VTPNALAATHLAAFGSEKAWTTETFAKFLNDPRVLFAGDIESFVLGRVVADEAEILTVATAPHARRAGLARGGLSQFLDRARLAGAKSVFLEVAEDNIAAISLYQSADFEQVGARKNYYARTGEAPVTALILRKNLA